MAHLKSKVGEYGVVLNKENKFIIVEPVNAPGKWLLPGGRLEERDSPRDGVIREVKEETNLDVKVIFPVHMARWGHDSPQKYGVFFLCRAKSFNVKLDHENTDFKWIGFDEVNKIKWRYNYYKEAVSYAKKLVDKGIK